MGRALTGALGGMSFPVQVTYRLSLEDYRAVTMWAISNDVDHMKARNSISIWIAIVTVAFAVFAGRPFWHGAPIQIGKLSLLVVGLTYAAHYYRTYAKRVADGTIAREKRQPRPGLFDQTTLTADESQIEITDPHCCKTLQWSALTKATVLPEYLILWSSYAMEVIIPRNACVGREFGDIATLFSKKISMPPNNPLDRSRP